MKKQPRWLAELPKWERLVRATLYIDIGSRFTRVVYKNKLVWHQPTTVTFHAGSQTVVEIGQKAWHALGKTPPSVQVLFPIQAGKISDIPVSVQYLRALIKSVLTQLELPFVLQLSAVVGIGSSLSPVELRTWTNVLHEAGFQSVKLVKKSLGLANHQTQRPVTWCLEIGDQTTEMGIFVGPELVKSWSWKFGGQAYTQELQDLVRSHYQATLSQMTAESIKTQQRSLVLQFDQDTGKNTKTSIRASDAVTHEPKVVYLERHHLIERFAHLSQELIQEIQTRLGEVSPDVARTVLENGLLLSGGAGQLSGLREFLATELHTECAMVEQPELELVWGLSRSADSEANK